MFANLQARRRGFDRSEITAELGWRLGLEVEHINRAHAALQVDNNERDVAASASHSGPSRLGGRLSLEQVGKRQRETQRPGESNLQHIAAADPVTACKGKSHFRLPSVFTQWLNKNSTVFIRLQARSSAALRRSVVWAFTSSPVLRYSTAARRSSAEGRRP